MTRKLIWSTASVLVLGILGAGIVQLSAQAPERPPEKPRDRPPERRGDGPGMAGLFGPGPVGRYTVVRAAGDQIILLDTVTGDLYEAGQKDIKKMSDRPKMERPRMFERDGLGPREGKERDRGRPRGDKERPAKEGAPKERERAPDEE